MESRVRTLPLLLEFLICQAPLEMSEEALGMQFSTQLMKGKGLFDSGTRLLPLFLTDDALPRLNAPSHHSIPRHSTNPSTCEDVCLCLYDPPECSHCNDLLLLNH